MINNTRTQTNRPGPGRFAPMTMPGAGLHRTLPTMSTPWVNLAPGMGTAGVGARYASATPTHVQLNVPMRWRR